MMRDYSNRQIFKKIFNPRVMIRFGRFTIQNLILLFEIKFIRNKVYLKGKVTIITPTMKRISLLREAIKSVQDQSYENWEQIIVSDGFEEDVKKMVENLKDPRVTYHFTYPLHTMGNYQRNYALKFATGEFILYLDDDNILFRDCLKKMITGFHNEEIGYVLAPILYGKNKLYPKYPFELGKIDLLNYMVRRRLIEKANGQDRYDCADLHLIQTIDKIAKGSSISDLVAHHR